jgi:glycosyltransferase involved in cell wall biosynthesis
MARARKSANVTLNMIQQLELADACEFVGEIFGEEKIRAYLNSDLFVFPPLQPEGLPWVIIEAMSARLPVITTDQGAIAEVVEDGLTGLIIKPCVEELARQICYLLENPEMAKTMGERGTGSGRSPVFGTDLFRCVDGLVSRSRRNSLRS